ncbi:cytidylate kinase [Saccharospirillum sp. MSK14-1]|uniref:(d)CMP kinase n=1 Tax=Saccharospirillum sp. MSK14-1 TaxID=1897632 RepID=UPI000D399E90|nr:(d)CMP kinase [Saccharospirillum sp. MSK14-1]PTY36369.1 cytidylate kinase [Saccharospirillum sp. MSK14-1]
MNSKAPVITLDGPGGVGKGTVSGLLARRFSWHYLDSGALYRLAALAAMNHGVDFDNESALAVIAEHLDIRFQQEGEAMVILLEGDDVTRQIRTEEVGSNASRVAAFGRVREALLKRQRAFRTEPGLIADGRDMGTVVFPEANLKIFMTASAEERANRRFKQLRDSGASADYDRVLADIVERDERDSNRSVAPLKPADDAVVIDTTVQSIDQVMDTVLALVTDRGIEW